MIGTAKANVEGKQTDVIIVDNDVAFEGEIKKKDIANKMDLAHEETENLFLELMKENYLDSLGVR